MNVFKILLPVITALVLYSCSDSPGNRDISERKDGFTKVLNTREDSLYNDVMEGHDVGMARMGKLSRYIKATSTKLDSLNAAGNKNKSLKDSLTILLQELKQAEAGMNMWMDEFQPDSAKSNETMRLLYLENEKQKVEKVRDRILGSIRKGDSLLQ